ncbi:MAG: hypothetical protein AAGI52_12055 [Bacteroidota bacterium]
MDRFLRSRLARVTGLLTVIAAGAVTGTEAYAQGSFQTLDPFYGGESARQTFFDGLAVSGEATYRDRDLLGLSEPGAPASDLVLAARLDYALLPQVDVSAVADLTGAARRGPLGLSWVVVKPYWRNENTDYAVRVAVDPASEGGLGFRQTDVAFLSSTALSPEVTSDFAIGYRRVQTGFVEAEAATAGAIPFGQPPISTDGESVPLPTLAALAVEGDRVRLIGKEFRGSWGYNVLFDPAGSRVHGSLIGEVGDYTLVRSGAEADDVSSSSAQERIRSGIGWARLGVEFNRPSYVLAPYVSVPVVTWANVRGEPVLLGPRAEKARFGVRVMLR